jgi:hypothetical protein
MRRRTFDFLATSIGAVLTVVLLIAGGLLLWGATFANNNVHNQLSQQQITFPPASAFVNVKAPPPGSFAEITPSMIPSVSQYAGQQLTTGPQAQVYANAFIGEHLTEIGQGHTYAYWSAKAMSLPAGSAAATAASNTADTLFKGTTLRGLLLEAYGFSVMGTIAWYAALASFILAGVFFLLTLLGFLHFRKEDEKEELLAPKSATNSKLDKEPVLV